jgi:hypothetical protein
MERYVQIWENQLSIFQEPRRDTMNRAVAQKPEIQDIVRNIEDAVESANLLALELTLKSFENDAMSESRVREIESIMHVAERAMAATSEIEKLVKDLRAGHYA